MAQPEAPRTLTRSDLVILVGGAAAIVVAGITRYAHAGAVLAFACSAVAVALLAALVGRSVEQMGDRFGAGATGVLQSALGNLPELFIAFFALRAGLLIVVQSAIIGSMLANLLLVLGLAFLTGGLRHGTQRFEKSRARDTCVLLALATAALVLPSMAQSTHSAAADHIRVLSDIAAVVLLIIFALSLPASLRRQPAAPGGSAGNAHTEEPRWPLAMAVGLLAAAGLLSALVSDWFVTALQPAINSLHMSQAFAGLVVVAIAGNAIENVVGIQLAMRNQADYALSVIINSPLQIALVLAPALVLLSLATATTLTLVFAPMLVAAVVVTVLIVSLIVFDGESNWLEGATLIGLYVIIAA
ncbi:MAG TPA: calcium/proton exchanger, partial [Gaiellales bacterium]|nr:calcium/proton exchanger [Gaiellales bacterium]